MHKTVITHIKQRVIFIGTATFGLRLLLNVAMKITNMHNIGSKCQSSCSPLVKITTAPSTIKKIHLKVPTTPLKVSYITGKAGFSSAVVKVCLAV